MKKHPLINVLFLMILLYLLQFIIIPLFYFPTSNEGTGILIISTLILTATGIFLITEKLYYWLINDVVYAILIYIYHPKGIYGIGMVGLFEASHYRKDAVPLKIAILIIILIVIQVLVWIFAKVMKYILGKRKLRF